MTLFLFGEVDADEGGANVRDHAVGNRSLVGEGVDDLGEVGKKNRLVRVVHALVGGGESEAVIELGAEGDGGLFRPGAVTLVDDEQSVRPREREATIAGGG